MWDSYVASRPEACLSQLSGWCLEVMRALGHEPVSIWAADDQGAVQGVLPLGLRRSWLFGTSLISIPGSSWAGGLASSPEAAEFLATEALHLGRTLGVEYVELRDGSEAPSSFEVSRQYCRFPIPLNRSLPKPDERTRRRLRKAREAKLECSFSPDNLDRFFDVYAEAMARLGSPPFGKDFFRCIRDSFPEVVRILVVSRSGEALAADFLTFWNGNGASLFAGATDAGRRHNADLVAIHAGLEEAVRLGCSSFDLGRSPAGSGGQTFKEHWGARGVPLRYWSASLGRQSRPDLNPNLPRWRLARAFWRFLPRRVQIELGAKIAPSLL